MFGSRSNKKGFTLIEILTTARPELVEGNERSNGSTGSPRAGSNGFTLIEILIAIVIMGIMLAVVVPNFRRLFPAREREQFVNALSALTRYAWQHALIERKNHKVIFDFTEKKVWIEMATGTTKSGQAEFGPLKRAYVATSLVIPKSIEIKNFIIEGYDEISRYGGGSKAAQSWFFITPDGLTQTVTINFVSNKETAAGRPRQFGLVLNPFNAQFKVYDSFQK
jgi:prepilin-type N-terminal cleavage/methylation domain-containing protein